MNEAETAAAPPTAPGTLLLGPDGKPTLSDPGKRTDTFLQMLLLGVGQVLDDIERRTGIAWPSLTEVTVNDGKGGVATVSLTRDPRVQAALENRREERERAEAAELERAKRNEERRSESKVLDLAKQRRR